MLPHCSKNLEVISQYLLLHDEKSRADKLGHRCYPWTSASPSTPPLYPQVLLIFLPSPLLVSIYNKLSVFLIYYTYVSSVLASLEYKPHQAKDLLLSCSLMDPKDLEQCVLHGTCSVNTCYIHLKFNDQKST